MSKPSLISGTRDLGPAEVAKRNYIFDTIKTIYRRFGYLPLETPAMEKLSTLTGKYGDEGDQLLYRLLNSGNFLSEVSDGLLQQKDYQKISPLVAEKGLRYDLTVPFARYVVMNQNQLAFPFKRYQIQPVWRAERSQAGRYKEFYQCDADAIGSDSLLYEAEILQMLDQVFALLGVKVQIKLNNRKLLNALSEYAGYPELFSAIVSSIDKLDKIGKDGVDKELSNLGISAQGMERIHSVLACQNLDELGSLLAGVEIGNKGIAELQSVLAFLQGYQFQNKLQLDFSLARGLSYYTGAIMEVVVDTNLPEQAKVKMGSIAGGGRYDNLTAVFGLPNMSGVGISFGADRIFDVLNQLNLYPESCQQSVKALLVHFDEQTLQFAFQTATQLRAQDIAVDIYPKTAKLKKQLEYAQKRGLAYVVICEQKEGKLCYQLKDMQAGSQSEADLAQIIGQLSR